MQTGSKNSRLKWKKKRFSPSGGGEVVKKIIVQHPL